MFNNNIDKLNSLYAFAQKYLNFPKWFMLERYFLSFIPFF